jgi:dihydroneopterin aldolase
MPSDLITVSDLEVWYRVGVPDEERVNPQRLLLTVELETDFTACAAGEDLSRTINYFDVCRRLTSFGENRSWKLIETLAVDIATLILSEFHPHRVTVEVKKFIIREARHISVRVTRTTD